MPLLAELDRLPRPFVLCIVTEVEGGSPGKPGFKMAVFSDGSSQGTVGGGDIERTTVEVAREMIARRTKNLSRVFTLSQDPGGPPGSHKTSMICGGSSTVYFELFESPQRALLFGGGHIAQSLAPLLLGLGFSVEVLDDRVDYATPEKYPSGTAIRIGEYVELASSSRVDGSTYCFVFTHGHAHDHDVLKALLQPRNLDPSSDRFSGRYVGMIGSRTKVKDILARIEESGVPRTALEGVHTPIGLDLGGDTPFEIAISIVAQVQAVRHEKPAPHMSAPRALPEKRAR
jgi:xanthine dehydrogenase accessory factor